MGLRQERTVKGKAVVNAITVVMEEDNDQQYVGEVVEASDITQPHEPMIVDGLQTGEITRKTADKARNKRILKKEPNPGQFFVPCSISGVSLNQSLCDTGANVNVMSQALASKLRLRELKKPRMTIEVPNAIEMVPTGFIQDVMVEIEGCLVPTDFLILEGGNTERPIILGSSFLATVGAVADFSTKRIFLTKVNPRKYYPLSYQDEITRASPVKEKKLRNRELNKQNGRGKPPWLEKDVESSNQLPEKDDSPHSRKIQSGVIRSNHESTYTRDENAARARIKDPGDSGETFTQSQ